MIDGTARRRLPRKFRFASYGNARPDGPSIAEFSSNSRVRNGPPIPRPSPRPGTETTTKCLPTIEYRRLQRKMAPSRSRRADRRSLAPIGRRVVALGRSLQCRKCRIPVNAMAIPAASAAAMTSASRIEPPGWMTAVAPASIAATSPSAKGKKASEATTEPCVREAGSPAARAASAGDVRGSSPNVFGEP